MSAFYVFSGVELPNIPGAFLIRVGKHLGNFFINVRVGLCVIGVEVEDIFFQHTLFISYDKDIWGVVQRILHF